MPDTPPMEKPSLLLVGCGKMGGAMLEGWLHQGYSKVMIVAPHSSHPTVPVIRTPEAIPADFTPDVVVLAVKPQKMAEVAPLYAHYHQAVFLSIAAGTTTQTLQRLLGEVAVVRSMPNLPSTICQGITAYYCTAQVSTTQRHYCRELLEAVGTACDIAEEHQMDAVTAISGSGPAYIFHLIETLAAAGEKLDLPAGLAYQLALHTVTGSAAMAAEANLPASQLRENVTSPGGTTAAALEVLMAEDNSGLAHLLERVTQAAARRSRELSQ